MTGGERAIRSAGVANRDGRGMRPLTFTVAHWTQPASSHDDFSALAGARSIQASHPALYRPRLLQKFAFQACTNAPTVRRQCEDVALTARDNVDVF